MPSRGEKILVVQITEHGDGGVDVGVRVERTLVWSERVDVVTKP
jgi:hypothetical protein